MMIQYTLNSLLPPLSVYHTGSMCDISTYFFYLTNITYIYICIIYYISMVNIPFGSRRHGLGNDPASKIEMDSAYSFEKGPTVC